MKIKTEDLRAGLNDFSPEQQIEKEVNTIDASAKALADASKVLADLVGQIGGLASRLEKANVIRISSKTKEEMSSMTVQMVTDASKVLDTRVKETLLPFTEELKRTCKQISDRERQISMPIFVAYSLLSVFLCSITYCCIVIFANYRLIHSVELWKCAWLMIGMAVFLVILLGYCGYRKWL